MSEKKIQPSSEKLTQPPRTPAISKKLKYTLAIIIGVFAFILYSGSLTHDYTLDDHPVIDENSITTRGLDGIPILLNTDYWFGAGQEQSRGPVYRPASMIVFATVWEFSPNNPHAYHFINVLLYAITCIILFLVLNQLFKHQDLLFPFACALLYTAHPIHTEVVNNIKSLDEILCLLFGLISLSQVLRYTTTNSKLALILGGVSFYLSLISKETGITFLVIIPLAVYFFRESSIKRISIPFFVLLLLTGIWLLVRMSIFKELPQNTGTVSSVLNNTLNAAPDSSSRYATVFYILLRYLGLLLLPHPLSSDYSFSEIKLQTFSDPMALLGLIIYVGMGVYAILSFRKKSVLSFAILFYLITLAPVSNFFFLVGSTMAERFLYIPSVGFCMVLAYFLAKIIKSVHSKSAPRDLGQFLSYNKSALLIMVAISVLYFIKTTSRTKDWKDNISLLSQDVKVSTNSARANQILGSALMLDAMKAPDATIRTAGFVSAKAYLMKALQIYPHYYAPLSHLGVIYLYEGKFDSAHASLKRGLELMPNDVDLNFNYGLVLFNQKKYDEAIRVLNHTVQLSPAHESAHYNLAALYQNTRDHDKAITHYAKVLEINPNNANAYYNTSVMLRARGENAKADEFLKKAQSLGYKVN
jgi:tetratricopeptide (TPR) repeat protein